MWQRKSQQFIAQLLHLRLTGLFFTLLTTLGQTLATIFGIFDREATQAVLKVCKLLVLSFLFW